MELKFEHFATQGQVRHHIQSCEGKHKQQVVYSSYHDALTQICYGCKKIRSNCNFEKDDVEVASSEINSSLDKTSDVVQSVKVGFREDKTGDTNSAQSEPSD